MYCTNIIILGLINFDNGSFLSLWIFGSQENIPLYPCIRQVKCNFFLAKSHKSKM